MKQLPLQNGKFALVDDEDFEWLSTWNWYCDVRQRACRTIHNEWTGRKHSIRMHRQIMGMIHDSSLDIDHINGDGLDNRKANLRICTHQQNMCNSKKTKSKMTSKFKGVCLIGGKWLAKIYFQNQQFPIGRFDNETDAARAYNRKALELHRKFARLNPV